jgi:diamine N-acetyltransferase
VILEDVDADNRRACTALEVDEQQQRFVVPITNYLAQCAEEDSPWHPLAVRVQQEIVGFVLGASIVPTRASGSVD